MGKLGGKSGPKRKANPGVGVDFKRVKHKVGKRLKPAQNETNVDFKSCSINLPGQSVAQEKGSAVNFQNLTLKELLSSTSHYSEKARTHALSGLSDLFSRHPTELTNHTHEFFSKIAERITDTEADVRKAFRVLLKDSVLPLVGAGVLRPFMPLLMAHVCGAMTHLSLAIRMDALKLLQLLMEHSPGLVVDGHLGPCLRHFSDLLSQGHRGRSIKAQSVSSLHKALTALHHFLSHAFGSAATTPASRVPPSSNIVTAASTTPLAQHSNTPAVCLYASRSTFAPQRAAPTNPLLSIGASIWAAATANNHAAHTAAADRRHGGKHPLTAHTGLPDRSGMFQSTTSQLPSTLTTNASHKQAQHNQPGRGAHKPMAAAASAAVITTGSRSHQEDAAESRSAALQLLLLLFDACWAECVPGLVQSMPELEAVQALTLLASCASLLLQHVLLTGGSSNSFLEADRALLQQLQRPLLKRLAANFPANMPAVPPAAPLLEALGHYNLAIARLLSTFLPLGCHGPMESSQHQEHQLYHPQQPVGHNSQQHSHSHAHQSQEPLHHHHQHAQQQHISPATNQRQQHAANLAQAATHQWISAVVALYVNVLERGQLVPLGVGGLTCEPHSTSNGAREGPSSNGNDGGGGVSSKVGGGVTALPAAACAAVLQGAGAAVRVVDPFTAGHLMHAIAAFGARQSCRSASRVACLRLQHTLLQEVLQGQVCVDEVHLRLWLTPLPKLLWDAADSAPEVSRLALHLLLDAARMSVPGRPLADIITRMQVQLAPLFCTELPPQATGGKKRAASSLTAGQSPAVLSQDHGDAATATAVAVHAAADGIMPCTACCGREVQRVSQQPRRVVLAGPLSKLSEEVAAVAVDILCQLGTVDRPILKAILPACCSTLYSSQLAVRILDVVLAKAHCIEPSLMASWMLSILFASDAPVALAPAGVEVGCSWDRQRALVDTAVAGLDRYTDAGSLLFLLQPHLEQLLPLGGRLQQYSFVRLCTLAAVQAGHRSSTSSIQTLHTPGDNSAHGMQTATACSKVPGTAVAPSAALVDVHPTIPSTLHVLLPTAAVELSLGLLVGQEEGSSSARLAMVTCAALLQAHPTLLLPFLRALVQHTKQLLGNMTAVSKGNQQQQTPADGAAPAGIMSRPQPQHGANCVASSCTAACRLAVHLMRAEDLKADIWAVREGVHAAIRELTDPTDVPSSIMSDALFSNERTRLQQVTTDALGALA